MSIDDNFWQACYLELIDEFFPQKVIKWVDNDLYVVGRMTGRKSLLLAVEQGLTMACLTESV